MAAAAAETARAAAVAANGRKMMGSGCGSPCMERAGGGSDSGRGMESAGGTPESGCAASAGVPTWDSGCAASACAGCGCVCVWSGGRGSQPPSRYGG